MNKSPPTVEAVPPPSAFATEPLDQLFETLASSPQGLAASETKARRKPSRGSFADRPWVQRLLPLLAQFKSPITLILIGAALLSMALGGVSDASIILLIVVVSAGLGYWQESRAAGALAELLSLVQIRGTVLRSGAPVEVPVAEIVSGDVLRLSAGSMIPADCRLLWAKDLFVNESALTGETYPVEKHADATPTSAERPANVVFQGTHVVSGTAEALAVLTGDATTFGKLRTHLRERPPETDFERGVRQFGNFLLELTMLLVLSILGVHLAIGHPAMESFLFSLALAVGLTPQLLPAVISVNLAQGARRLARFQVIVRRLSSIENFGSMDVLCSDKTGTLTLGEVRLKEAIGFEGQASTEAMRLAWLNAQFETGFLNPIDEALRKLPALEGADVEKLDEIPYDFVRKRLSVLVRQGQQKLLIVKGAVASLLDLCDHALNAEGREVPFAQAQPAIERLYQQSGEQGYRALAVARRIMDQDRVAQCDERQLVFVGLLLFEDPPKPNIEATIAELRRLGIELKVITGDNRVVAATLGRRMGLDPARLLIGPELRQLEHSALVQRVQQASIFAEVEPNQKERIIVALKSAGRVVGYLGDGINDATALHAADVGISVAEAVDVAREAADIVLLKNDLNVLIDGVRAGRATFANTMKYVLLATSANFGNMFSMAGASLFLPYLPLLPKQVLLTNLLTDLPEMTIASDQVDSEWMERPQRWNVASIRRFMLVFGLISSVFDYATFGILLRVLHAKEDEFRTGWFVESVVSACLVVLVVRTKNALWSSRPAVALAATTLAVAIGTIALPFTPLAARLGFTTLPVSFLVSMLAIVALYLATAEAAKRWFYRGERDVALQSRF